MEVGFNLIIGILVTLLFSGFFSGMEIAFVSSNRMLAEMDKDKNKNGVSQRLVSLFYSHPNGFVSTMLVGNNIALVVYGILIARLFDNTIFRGMDAAFTVPADTILSTIIVLFTGEFLPKTLFKSHRSRGSYQGFRYHPKHHLRGNDAIGRSSLPLSHPRSRTECRREKAGEATEKE